MYARYIMAAGLGVWGGSSSWPGRPRVLAKGMDGRGTGAGRRRGWRPREGRPSALAKSWWVVRGSKARQCKLMAGTRACFFPAVPKPPDEEKRTMAYPSEQLRVASYLSARHVFCLSRPKPSVVVCCVDSNVGGAGGGGTESVGDGGATERRIRRGRPLAPV
jgi:hypothetical protein